jgi:hypothetical protein
VHDIICDILYVRWEQDIYATFAHLAGADPTDHSAAAAGLPAVDSINLWSYLSGEAGASPRKMIPIGSTSCEGGAKRKAQPFSAPFHFKCKPIISLDRRGTNGMEKSLENPASFVGFKEGCINQWGWGDVKTIVQGLIQDRGSEVTSLLNCTGAVWRANVAPAEGLKGATFRTILYSSYCTRQSTRSSIPRGTRSDHWCSLTGGIYIICFGLLTGDLEDHDRSESNERVAGAALP